MNDFIYLLSAILVGFGFLSVAGMFVAAIIVSWKQFGGMIRERRDADAQEKWLEQLNRSPV